MSKFNERIKTERDNLVKKTFSVSLFVELMQEYINDPDFEAHIMKTEGEKAVKVLKYPVKDFRKIVKNVLIDYGVDAKEAESIMTTYKFKSKDLEGLYLFMNEFMYQYMQTGRQYRVFDREDVTASLYLKEVEGSVKEYDRMYKDEKGKLIRDKSKKKRVKQDKHLVLGRKSSCPKWNKSEVDKNDKVIKAMEKVVKGL